MPTPEPVFGVAPDGTPYPVHAAASPDYGAGAILGLVVGLCRVAPAGGAGASTGAAGGGLTVVAMAASLTESLMTKGRLDAEDLARRYRAWPTPPPAEAPLRALPVALFYAGQPDELARASVEEARVAGADARAALASVLVSAAVSAGTYELGKAYDMAIAAVQALDAAAAKSEALAPIAEGLRDDLRAAVGSPTIAAMTVGTDPLARALRLAFWHLLHTADLEAAISDVAARGEPIAAGLTGLLVGAALGEDAVPARWRDTFAGAAAPLMEILAPAAPD